MLNCNFTRINEEEVECRTCGRKVVTTSSAGRTYAMCKDQVKRFQLGDEVEKALTVLGITKQRYRAAKEALGLPPTCDCAKRQKWLNQMGERLQVSAGKLKEIYDGYYATPR